MNRSASSGAADQVEEMVTAEVAETIDDIVLRVVAKACASVTLQRAAAAAFIRHGGNALARLASEEDAAHEHLKNERRHRDRAAKAAHKTRRGII